MSDLEFYRPMKDEGDAWREESWTAHGGQHVSNDPHMHVDTCIYYEGEHVYAGQYCPHYNGVDDSEQQRGWTVLSNRKGNND